jgi:hypothetical protein
VDDALLGFACLECPLARGTNAILSGPVGGGIGLSCESVVEEAFGKGGADGEGDLFEFGKGSTPGQTIGAVNAVDEVFGDAIKEGTQILYLGGGRFLRLHLSLLKGVR